MRKARCSRWWENANSRHALRVLRHAIAERPVYYFNVEAIEPAADRIKASSGKITNGPMEVPGGQWIVQGTDPQGATFALVGKRN